MRITAFFILVFLTSSIYAQDTNNSVPTFFGGNTSSYKTQKKIEIIFKTLDFISGKTDSLFLKRMKLKENDSIEFEVSYVIDKYGLIEKDSTLINTPVVSFNNYMKLIINTLPRFTPAVEENGITTSYKIEFTGRFNIKNNKLNPFQYEVEKSDDDGDIPDELPYAVIEVVPIFPGCEGLPNNKLADCFNQKMMNHINLNLSYSVGAPVGITEIRVETQFLIDKNGDVTDIKTRARIAKGGKQFENEAYRIISLLPKFTPGYQKGKTISVRYSQPMTFKFQ
ncbi:energy transducer TonB [Flavobacterium sp.]|uniref:energy transducer TonB n=1 Tax=Flavobacterium sp. TaxID=239 RepID=UPI003D29D83C